MLSAIVAMDSSNVIGLDGGIPWDCPADRNFFKEFIKGKNKICGRKTWDTIKNYKWTTDINVISRDKWIAIGESQDCQFIHCPTVSVSEYLRLSAELFLDYVVIGGAEIYALAAPYVSSLYVTRIERSTCNPMRATIFPWNSYQRFSWTSSVHAELEDDVVIYKMDRIWI